MATKKVSRIKSGEIAFALNGRKLNVTAPRVEYTRMLKRFTELAVAQRAAADETIDKFKDDVDSFCADADEWAHQYIDTAADLAVEELVAKGCLDVDRDTFVNDYLNSYLWDKRIKELRALASALREEEEEREARRQNRTESARHLFDDDYDDEKMMNLASAGVSGLFNMIGRGMSNAEMSGKIKAKFDEDREAYLRAIYMTIRTSVDECVSCLADKGKGLDGGGVGKEDREKADRLFNNLSRTKMPKKVAEEMMLEILQLDPYKQEFYEWCFMENGDLSGELEKIAEYFGVSLSRAKAAKFAKELGECDYETEEATLAYRERAVALSKELRYEATEKLAEIDERLKEFDLQARTVEDRVFESREEATKQRELADFEKNLDLSSEEQALSSKKKLLAKIKTLGIDGAWKVNRVNESLARFDEIARTVDDRTFETREEAALQRELSEFEQRLDLSNEESALKSRELLVGKISELRIDGAWKLERVDAELRRFDELARTTFGLVFDTREAAAEARGRRDEFYRGVVALAERSGESGFYFEGVMPAKKLANAQKAFPIPLNERVLCLTDTTFFGSGKTGLAITVEGLRWANGKSVSSGKSFLRWRDFADGNEAPKRFQGDRMVLGENAVYANAGSNVNDRKMGECLVSLYGYCQQATFDFGGEEKSRCSANRMTSAEAGVARPVSHFEMSECFGFLEVVERAARQLAGCAEVFVGENIPPKKLANACKSMNVKEPAGEVALLVDATIFGSAKDGLAVTPRAVYFKNGFEHPIVVPWTKLEAVEIQEDGNLSINAYHFQTIGMEKVESESLVDVLNTVREWMSAQKAKLNKDE